MDKNKSAYKLDGLPKVYWINLDSDVRRRRYMEDQFSYWKLMIMFEYLHMMGELEMFNNFFIDKYPDNVTTSEIGCCMSHLSH